MGLDKRSAFWEHTLAPLALTFFLAVGLSACDSRAQSAREPEATLARSSGGWRTGAEPFLRIGGDPSSTWGEVVGLSVLPDGRVVVAGDYPPALSVFAVNGRLLRTIGRRGRGPGEFMAIGVFRRYGDTLFVADLDDVGQHFALDGTYARTSARPVETGRLHGVLATGDRVVGRLELGGITPDVWAQAPEVLERMRDGARVSLGSFPSQRLSRTADGQLKGEVFSPHNRVAVFPDGFCAGYAGGREIRCHDADGRQTGVVSLAQRQPQLVAEVDREAYFNDQYIANPSTPKSLLDADVAQLRATTTFASSLGVFGRLLASQDGLLWVGPPSTDAWRIANRNAVPDSAALWSVYTRAGAWVAEVTLPARFLPLDAGADFVAGVSSGEDDGIVVVVYRLLRN